MKNRLKILFQAWSIILVFFTLPPTHAQVGAEPQRPFVTTWDTDPYGHTGDRTVYIRTHPDYAGQYHYQIDMDYDGVTFDVDFDHLTGNHEILYTTPGTYTIAIRGEFPGLADPGFKLSGIHQWGDIRWKTMNRACWHASRLTNYTATDVPDLSQVTDMSFMFYFANNFNGDISHWDVSQVTNMTGMFTHATQFDQNIGGWDVSHVETMDYMFFKAFGFDQSLAHWNLRQVQNLTGMLDESAMSIENYDATLLGWVQNPDTPLNLRLGAKDLLYCDSVSRHILIRDRGWTITQDDLSDTCIPPQRPFVTSWQTNPLGGYPDKTIHIRINDAYSGQYNYQIDKDYDGVTFDVDYDQVTGSQVIRYETPGTYTVAIRGDFPAIEATHYTLLEEAYKLQGIHQWGDIEWKSMEGAFKNHFNLHVYTATDQPDLSQVSDLSFMFQNARRFNGDISQWDVSQVSDMSDLLSGATAFDQNLGEWDLNGIVPNLFGSLRNMLNGTGLSVENYDATLAGWANNPNTPKNMILGATGLQYCSTEHRNQLVRKLYWTINGDSQSKLCLPGKGTVTGERSGRHTAHVTQTLAWFPNPVEEMITLQGGHFDGQVKVEIFDLAGQQTRARTVNFIRGSVQLDLSELSPGLYTVRLSDAHQTQSFKLVKK